MDVTWDITHVTLTGRIMKVLIPDHMKRIIVISSLFRIITTNGLNDTCDLKTLNDTVRLADDHASTALPSLLYKTVWGIDSPIAVSECSSIEELGQWAKSLASKTPYALRYSTIDVIASDIYKTLALAKGV